MISFRGVTFLRRLVTAVAAVCLLILEGNPASASKRTPVDPSIMQPALNPTFMWECWRVDDTTVCDGERHLSWTAADTGLPCVAGPIYSTGTDDRFLRRWGDAEGRALHSHGVANISETLALNPDGPGRTASSAGHFSQRFTYAVPGDQSTRVEVLSGSDVTVVVFHASPHGRRVRTSGSSGPTALACAD
jgi:hypothetical protein